MDENRKCTSCGSHDLHGYAVEGECFENICSMKGVLTYACRQCGHVEWFLTKETIRLRDQREKQASEYRDKLEQYEKKRAELQKQMEDLQEITKDENQTVRTVNEAKEKIVLLERELRNLHKPAERNGFPL